MQNFSSEAATGGGAGFWGAPPVQMAPIPRPRRGGRRQSLVDPVANAEFEAHLNHEMGGFFARAGTKYVGQIAEGDIHGEGTKTLPDGTVQKGRFEHDKFMGK
jgi:hypothetical protein